ncbi:MAG: DEAD/DEAH box helicase family protein, partial [Actinomycetota bacterium]|nr:DEAD/DEAH box helicase family protein [Actinomycetota bacterium]
MSDPNFDAERVLRDLRPFQQRTVEHVVNQMYRTEHTRRFLVADDTGLGKSLVARGVIARAIEQLQTVDTVDRIDIVYVCSNLDIARQNINRLNVIGTEVPMTTRLSLLATRSVDLNTAPLVGHKPVNLVSLTPRTSFEKGWRTGRVDERALLMTILATHLNLSGARYTAACRVLKGSIPDWRRFSNRVDQFQTDHGATLDQTIIRRFLRLARRRPEGDMTSPLHRFSVLVEGTVGRSTVPGGDEAAAVVIGELRELLARAGVDTLQPDLIILDEFQRFTELLDTTTEVGQLAHELFEYPDARVLLLSATPYRAFTLDRSDGESDGAPHHTQFQQTIDFLAAGSKDVAVAQTIRKLLDDFRFDIVDEGDPTDRVAELRDALLTLMCRTERPATEKNSMVTEVRATAPPVDSVQVQQYLHLKRLAESVDAPLPIDVWKSVPHLAHFMDAYLMGRKADDAAASGDLDVREILAATPRIDPESVRTFAPIPAHNSRLQSLLDSTTERNWHTLLWVPPSLPYVMPDGPYADPAVQRMTKKLVFSSWSATPTSVASLLSYDANRRLATATDRIVENDPERLRRV